MSYSWSGGRIDSATRLFVFGRDGALVGDELDVDLGADSFLTGADIVMSGSSLLMHRTTGVGEAGEVGATDVLLYDCL